MLIATILIQQLSRDFMPVEVLLFGGVMLVIIVLIHGAGLDRIVARYKRKADMLRSRGIHPRLATVVFASAILLMLLLHVSEAAIWGLVLNRVGLIASLRDSMYFSANTYTTIGYGLMILPQSWRELAPIMAISGLFTFAWTTGEMFNIVGQQRDLVAELEEKRKREARPDAHVHQQTRHDSARKHGEGGSESRGVSTVSKTSQ